MNKLLDLIQLWWPYYVAQTITKLGLAYVLEQFWKWCILFPNLNRIFATYLPWLSEGSIFVKKPVSIMSVKILTFDSFEKTSKFRKYCETLETPHISKVEGRAGAMGA